MKGKPSSLGNSRPWWSGYAALAVALGYLVCAIVGRTIESALVERGLQAQEGDWGTFLLFALFATVAAVLIWLVPRNLVSWIFLAIVASAMLGFVGVNYAHYAEVSPLPGAHIIGWFSSWAWYLALGGMVTFLPLYFPTGRLLTPRWRWVLRLAILGLGLLCGSVAFAPGKLEDLTLVNPLGVQALAPYISTIEVAGNLVVAAAVILSLASSVVRFRRSRGEERQQLKWFVLAAGLLITSGVFLEVFPQVERALPEDVSNLLFTVTGSLLPLAAALAILKYRLYAIDTIINRVLVYGLLTAFLVGTYLLIVVGLQLILEPVTGESDLAVAVSTLAVAAAFRPVRDRVQRFIDRRFYRHKYDATELLATFAARLRNEVDLDAAHADVLQVVRRTMQPEHASLWVKPRSLLPPTSGAPT